MNIVLTFAHLEHDKINLLVSFADACVAFVAFQYGRLKVHRMKSRETWKSPAGVPCVGWAVSF